MINTKHFVRTKKGRERYVKHPINNTNIHTRTSTPHIVESHEQNRQIKTGECYVIYSSKSAQLQQEQQIGLEAKEK